mmetsp:Transcript_37947/g.80681  ORF Transcript_37947/g.80681 Transcript_37947/m.80681 type:complete len:201 (+) Transcript_37947:731-1333(+)
MGVRVAAPPTHRTSRTLRCGALAEAGHLLTHRLDFGIVEEVPPQQAAGTHDAFLRARRGQREQNRSLHAEPRQALSGGRDASPRCRGVGRSGRGSRGRRSHAVGCAGGQVGGRRSDIVAGFHCGPLRCQWLERDALRFARDHRHGGEEEGLPGQHDDIPGVLWMPAACRRLPAGVSGSLRGGHHTANQQAVQRLVRAIPR